MLLSCGPAVAPCASLSRLGDLLQVAARTELGGSPRSPPRCTGVSEVGPVAACMTVTHCEPHREAVTHAV